ncbi:MAG: hypothetical protein FWD15_06355 [Alphaproteobacteria bacterium]|nr:hypothetical protein [Alphaproteobacteria bacterium]
MTVKTVKSGEEYKLLNTKSTSKKIAFIFSFFWFMLVAVPATYITFMKSETLQKYLVVRGVYEANKYLLSQYDELRDRLTKRMDINKLTSKIKVPTINADSLVSSLDSATKEVDDISKQANDLAKQIADVKRQIDSAIGSANSVKVATASGLLRNVGVKAPADPMAGLANVSKRISDISSQATNKATAFAARAADISNKTTRIRNEVAGVNDRVKSAVSDAASTLATDFNKALHDEITAFGHGHMQSALNLSDANFKRLVANQYGLTGAAEKNLESIYAEFQGTQTLGIRHMMDYIKAYWTWIKIALIVIVAIITLVPIILAFKIAKTITGLVERCPHCNKLFIPKRAKFNVLNFLKFW